MKNLCLCLAGLCLLLGCGRNDSNSSNQSSSSSGNPVTAPVDYLDAVNKGRKSALKVIDIAPIKQAIQLFHAQEDRYPASLDELVSKRYLQQLPEAPAGSKLQYNPANGEVRFVKAP